VSPETRISPLQVEQALRLLPDVDALAPLRAFLVSTSRGRDATQPYRTVGTRLLLPADLTHAVPRAIARVTEHLRALYDAAVEALQAEQEDDLPAAVASLLRAGELEVQVGRGTQAHAWYDQALRIAETLRDRRPEIAALRRFGDLKTRLGRFDIAARYYQRSLAIAEAERDREGSARACHGLGEVALAQAKWQGAGSWYTRGLQCEADDPSLAAHLHLGLGEAARARGQFETAEDQLGRAQRLFATHGDDVGLARVLNAVGDLEALRERRPEALARYQEAFAHLRPVAGHPQLEIAIRLRICQLYLDWGRLPDAEDEIRRAEETAIVHNATRELARLYLVMGQVRGRQEDDTGFVFFEKAIELCRGPEPTPRLEAEVYLEYGLFRKRLGELEEAEAYLGRAREILEAIGNGPLLARVDAELATFTTV
jgi:tetratricopeptide (TPR) repeat protein